MSKVFTLEELRQLYSLTTIRRTALNEMGDVNPGLRDWREKEIALNESVSSKLKEMIDAEVPSTNKAN